MTRRTHEDIWEKIGALDARMVHVETKVGHIDTNVEKLTTAANMGKGAWWATVKFGGLVLMVLAAATWLWDRIKPMVAEP